jgi:hypothetical protein
MTFLMLMAIVLICMSSPRQPGMPKSGTTASTYTRSAPVQTVMSGCRRKEEAKRMSDSKLEVGVPTDATGRPDGENADVTRQAGGDHDKKPYASSTGVATNPNEAGDPDKLLPTSDTASMGDEAARDRMVRRENMLKEGKLADDNPDPLANKD